MSAGTLPPHITRALERLTEGVLRNDIAPRAAAMSENYRSGGGSNVIKDRTGALAYALARMPATYAAVSACLAALRDLDESSTPETILDICAGPGTATWAAAQTFPTLKHFDLLDANPALRDLALDIARADRRFDADAYRLGDASVELKIAEQADLVIASYAIGEMQDAVRADLIDQMWSKTKGTLLIVEPGTPDGYQRIIAARTRLMAAGAHVLAPCPHDRPCPLVSPDWCHFAQRLSRSRDHMHLKNADVPFEDEKFTYVAVTRRPTIATGSARVLAPPAVSKADIKMKVCTPDGDASIFIAPRRDKRAYAVARRLRWGDRVKTRYGIS